MLKTTQPRWWKRTLVSVAGFSLDRKGGVDGLKVEYEGIVIIFGLYAETGASFLPNLSK